MNRFLNSLYVFFLEQISYPYLLKPLTGNNYWQSVKDFQKLQFTSSEILKERAEKRIAKLLVHAYNNVPFYTESFRKKGLTPQDFRQIDDLQKFPILNKTDIRVNYLNKLKAKNIPEERFILMSTSGSTGVPTEFFIDKNCLSFRQAARTFFNYWAGIRPAGRRVWLCGPRPGANLPNNQLKSASLFSSIKRIGRRVISGPEETYHISSFDIRNENIKEILNSIIKYNPDFIDSYASVIVKLSGKLKEFSLKAPSNLKVIVLSSETVTSDEIDVVKEAFNCNTVNRYGCVEFGGAIAQNCPENHGKFHINTELVYVEIVGEDGKKTEPGKRGKILITDYNNFAMPFIRYDIGDYAILGEVCGCNRGFPVIDKIEGRSIEFINTPSGKSISSNELGLFLFRLRDYTNYIREYQVIQNKTDSIQLCIVPENSYNISIEKRLIDDLEDFIGKDVRISINTVPEIELEPSGKRLIIKSKVLKN
jgi:phenylacetate-CoA ligase